ncbi:U4/U6.U5 small nuclear ribonucleoprotein 27 kDa protein [Varanus komodoensis]|nr:U4/U6.U5 small nuclear ribonucleoprotein 27 kDa protein [Varanus komodoensis]
MPLAGSAVGAAGMGRSRSRSPPRRVRPSLVMLLPRRTPAVQIHLPGEGEAAAGAVEVSGEGPEEKSLPLAAQAAVQKERRDEEKKENKDTKSKERQITEEDLEGKTEEEIEMMKTMGFAAFDTTKARKESGWLCECLCYKCITEEEIQKVELKSLLMWVKEESAKVGLKLNIKKTKLMASGPLTSWQIDSKEMEVVTDFIFLGSKITADGDCSQEIKRRLLLGRKAMANLDSILKSRGITLPTKVHIVRAMVFPVAVYGCESWTIRKAERQRNEAFEWWCWRRLLRVPWTAGRSNRSVLEEINPDCSLEDQTVKLKLKYSGHLMRRKDSLEKSLMLGTIEGKRRRGRQRMRQYMNRKGGFNRPLDFIA